MREKLIELVLGSFTGRFFRSVEDGKYGSGAARLYASTKGRKTLVAAVLLTLAAASTEFAPHLTPALTMIGVVLGHAGLVDKGSRTIAPEVAVAWHEAAQWLAGLTAALSYVIFGAQELLGRVPGCEACSVVADRLGIGMLAVGTATSWFTAYLDPAKKRVF